VCYCHLLCSTLQAVRLGLSGFGAGLSVGKALIEEQACLLNGLLSYSSSLLGSPCKQCWLLQCWVLRVAMSNVGLNSSPPAGPMQET
jgi:hypothetical protein